MTRLGVIPACPTLVNHAVGIYDVVIANVAPAPCLGVKVPHGTYPSREVFVGIGRGGVVNNDMRDALVLGCPLRAALPLRRAPIFARYHKRLGYVGRCALHHYGRFGRIGRNSRIYKGIGKLAKDGAHTGLVASQGHSALHVAVGSWPGVLSTEIMLA